MELIKGAHDAYCNYFYPSKIIEQALINPTQYNNGIIMRANDRTYRERTKSSDVLDRILPGNDIDVLPRNNYPVFFGSMSTTDIYMRNEMSLYQAIVLKNKDKALITRIMYSGSVNPKREFCIKCGSKANNAAPINE